METCFADALLPLLMAVFWALVEVQSVLLVTLLKQVAPTGLRQAREALIYLGYYALLAAGTLTTGSLTLTDVQVLKCTPSTQDTDRQLAWQDAGSSPSSPTIPAVHAAGQDSSRRRAASESSAVAAAARMAMQYCVSASMTSNHPVSRAVVAAGGSLANQKGQQVTAFEQVRAWNRQGQPCYC